MTSHAQAGILQPVPVAGRHLLFGLAQPAQLRSAWAAFLPLVDGDAAVVGLGLELVRALGGTVAGLREFPALAVQGSGTPIPATPAALWVWQRGADRGDLTLAGRRIAQALSPALALQQVVETFQYG